MARCRHCREGQLQQGVKERDVVDECYIGETHRSVFTRSEAHVNTYEPVKGGVINHLTMRVFFQQVRRRLQIYSDPPAPEEGPQEAVGGGVLLDWAQSRGVIKMGGRGSSR